MNFKSWIGRFLCEFNRKQNKESIDALTTSMSKIEAPADVQRALNFGDYHVVDLEAVNRTDARILELKKRESA